MKLLHTKQVGMDELLDMMADLALEKLEEKYKVKRNRKSMPKKRTRFITKKAKSEVYERDGGKCENCATVYALEIEHIRPYAKGGSNDPANLKLLCRNCNQRSAIKEYGQIKMDIFLNRPTSPGK